MEVPSLFYLFSTQLSKFRVVSVSFKTKLFTCVFNFYENYNIIYLDADASN